MFNGLISNVRMANPWDIVDILLVAFLFYKLMRFMRNTNAQKLFQGLILLVAIMIQILGPQLKNYFTAKKAKT